MPSSALAQASDQRASKPHQAGDDLVDLADATAGVQRLRRYILGLALHGRLCPTSMRYQTADGLPVGWSWTAVGELGDCVLGKMLDRTKHKSGTSRPYLRNINVRWGTFDLSDLLEMFFEDDELERYGTHPGDVLICEGGEPGRSAVWTDRKTALIQKAIHRVRPGPRLLPDWLVLNLRYDSWTHRLDAHFTGATIKHFTGQALRAYTIRLPPLAEQKRIVAKVDQLMALCDELEAKQAKKRDVGDRLTKAALAALTSAETPEEFKGAWQRITDYFALFSTSSAISALRAAVLSLAFAGRFSGRRKSQHGTELPAGWSRCTLADLVDPRRPISYGVLVPGPDVAEGVPFVRVQDLSVSSPAAVPMKRIAPEIAKQFERTTLAGDEVLLGVVGSIGKVGIAPPTWRGAAIARAVCRVAPAPTVSVRFLALQLQSPAVQAHFESSTRTLAQPTLNVGMIRDTPVVCPPRAEQEALVKTVDEIFAQLDALDATVGRCQAVASRLAEALARRCEP